MEEDDRGRRKKLITWLDTSARDDVPKPAPLITGLALEALNLMGGQMDWSAVPYVFRMLGADDPARLIYQINAIIRYRQKEANAERLRK